MRKPTTVKSGDEIKFGSARFAFNPASVPKRLRSGLVILAVMFLAGFAVARYRTKIMPANPEPVAATSPPETNSAAAMNTQSASAQPEPTESSTVKLVNEFLVL